MRTAHIRTVAALGALAALASTPATAAPQDDDPDILHGSVDEIDLDDDLTELDLEDLLDIEVTVVSRRKESLENAPAAVYVVTGEEIRRAGHATIQDALRMVPGVFASRWRTSDWDVTIRGFGPGTSDVNLAYLNQVLIMVDGVVVYTPLYAGTWWGLQDFDMENIQRIEVIRGPSGILWGANAFHGVVNVITKESSENPGQRLSVRTSNDTSFVTLRSTGTLAEGVNYSAFARRSRYDSLYEDAPFVSEQATDLFDWGIDSGGLRLDGVTDGGYRWRLDGRGYEAEVGRGFQTGPTTFAVGEDRQYGGQLSYTLENPENGVLLRTAYVKDRQWLFDTASVIDIDQLQVDLSRSVPIGDHHRLQYGVGYDLVDSQTDFYAGFAVNSIRQNNFRAFVSDTWTIPDTDLALALGVQAIHNEFSGSDLQPSVRASWSPEGSGTFWASVSRAVRTPSIEEEVFGQGTFDEAESVVATELGWRGPVADGVTLDIALYYNDYDDVRLREFDPVTSLDTYMNAGSGSAKGGEIAFDVKAADWWTLRGSWSTHLSQHDAPVADAELEQVDSQYPVHMASLRSYIDLADDWEFDLGGYLVERFDGRAPGTDGPEYWRGDARLGWLATDDVRLGLGVQGFNDPTRSEFGVNEVRRLVYFTIDLTR